MIAKSFFMDFSSMAAVAARIPMYPSILSPRGGVVKEKGIVVKKKSAY